MKAETALERMVLQVLRGVLRGGEVSVKLSGGNWEVRGCLVRSKVAGRLACRIEVQPRERR